MNNVLFKRLVTDARMPTRAEGSAGYDVWPVSEGIIEPGTKVNIPLGFALAFESGYAAIIDDKSGIGNKGLTHLAGVLDADYRGEYILILHNLSAFPFTYSPAKAVAQILFLKVEEPVFETVETLPESARGSGRFGSTGH